MLTLGVASTGLGVLGATGSTVEEHLDGPLPAHAVVRTSANPRSWWGNFVQVLDPAASDRPDLWLPRFAAVFPAARHVAIGLPAAPTPETWAAHPLGSGLERSSEDVLVATAPPPVGSPPDGYTFRQVTGEGDWGGVLQGRLDENARTHAHPRHEHLRFETAAVASARVLTEAGTATWHAAFAADGALVGQAGIVDLGPGTGPSGELARIARYQTVIVHHEHRRRGIAAHLVALGAAWAARRWAQAPGPSAGAWVICADAGSDAGRLYRRLGFTVAGQEHGIAGARLG